jgi:di/tricarboxylate transporter
MTTLVATAPNLVVNSELERKGYTGFHFASSAEFVGELRLREVAEAVI